MTAVTLPESRQYVFWLMIKVIGSLLLGTGLIVFGMLIVGGYFLGEEMEWYVFGLGVFMIIIGFINMATAIFGIVYKLIADAVEAGLASAFDLETDEPPSFEIGELIDRIR